MIDLRVIYLLHVSCDGVSLRLLNLWDYRFYCLESLGTYFPQYFFVPIFFYPMGPLTTHLLACLKLLHNSVMLFNYSGFFVCVCVGGVSFWIVSIALPSNSLILLLLFSHSVMSDSATPWTAAYQVSLSFTISRSLLRFMSIE